MMTVKTSPNGGYYAARNVEQMPDHWTGPIRATLPEAIADIQPAPVWLHAGDDCAGDVVAYAND